ncbi:protein tyrosine phosphatase [Variovorax paradoxus]|uniref:protein-tyrosine-phosphatase n=1 Tax=Variovorax paradoxus TaxID=34073 RepID=A0AA91I9T5_VARPD|nr:low molecular weight protein-tyrosine-phosphatase [Variovorax paradoxus]OAK61369.1 protein tyrosine phosphatase [Variovorax paradoxus]
MRSVLVACIGNICRSPMAQALLASALPRLQVLSAGLDALVGQPADAWSRELMAQRGLDIEAHRARQLTAAMCQEADLILVMDEAQRHYLHQRYPLTRGKLFRLGEAAGMDVPDPYRSGRPAFERSLQIIDAGTAAWVERIRKLQ